MNNICKKTIGLVLAVAMIVSGIVPSSAAELKAKTTIKTKNISVFKGKKKTIKLKNKNSKCKYSFISNKKKVAKVSAKGVVTGVSKGKAKITVKQTVKKTKKTVKLGIVNVTVNEQAKKTEATNTPVVQSTPVPTATATASPTATPLPATCVNVDFSNGDISMFQAEGQGVKLLLVNDGVDDASSLKATGRTKSGNWWDWGCGMAIDLAKYVKPGKTYSVKCYLKCDKAATFTVRSKVNNGWFPNQVGPTLDVKAETWTEYEGIFASPDTINGSIILYWDASVASDIYLDSLVIKETKVLDSTFKDTFSGIFGNVGTCNTYTQMRDNKLFTTTLYNSVTMENETKPQQLLNKEKITSSVPSGYIIPDNYNEAKYPILQFDAIDQVIDTAYEYGLKIRFHVLVWHSQTPAFFFKKGYNENNDYVSKETMEARLEYYVKNTIKHIYETPHGKDVVYCWDVANEYFHNYDQGSKSMWNVIYYPNEKNEAGRTNKPEYVKNAFKYAHDELAEFGLEDKVHLFYNDYNTYEVSDEIVELINYINEEERICDGVGMQSHLSIKYPDPGMTGKIATTIDKFTKAGFEIQITELDVTDTDENGKHDSQRQEKYYEELIQMLVSKKKNGANITGITFWGLCDSNSWRRSENPLLFSALFCPKPVFQKVIEAAQNTWK